MPEYNFKITQENVGVRVDVFLASNISDIPSRTFMQKIIAADKAFVNNKLINAHYKLCEGDEIRVDLSEDLLPKNSIEPENILLDILYEDDYLLAINKPSGLLVHPAQGCYTGTLANALLYHCNKLSDVNSTLRPGIVHRLDQDTSGVILAVKDNKTHIKLAKQFENHEIKKTYVALVEGIVEFDEGLIDVPLGRDPIHRDKKSVQFDDSARESQTYYKVLKRFDKITYLELYPKTGRTHQIRVHLKYLGHPILGDEKYGKKSTFSRLALHAKSIGFTHPATKKFMEISSPLPSEFLEIQ